jgi:hypothetical protein
MQHRANNANCRLNYVLPWADTSHVRQRCNQTDGSVATHAEIAHVIKKDNASGVRWIDGIAQQRSDNYLRPARLKENPGSEPIVVVAQKSLAILKFALSKVGSACNHHPCWLSGSMRINDMKALEG